MRAAIRQILFADRPAFSPLSLFRIGEQGAWYDPSDMSTLYQDYSSNTPVTAVEQPVGLMLDKSKGLALGSTEIVTNGDFSNGTTGWTASSSATISVVNDELVLNMTGVGDGVSQLLPAGGNNIVLGRCYQLSFTVRKETYTGTTLDVGVDNGLFCTTSVFGSVNTTITTRWRQTASGGAGKTLAIRRTPPHTGTVIIDNISVREVLGNHASQSTSAARPVLSARYNLLLNTETLSTQSVTTVATTYTLAFSGAGSITLSGTKTGTYNAGTHSLTGVTAGTLTLTVSGTVTKADLRAANDGIGLPAYQRVTTATDYDTAGFPPYLKFDGVDDCLYTSAIDFTATDTVSCFSGVRKLSDATAQVLYELSENLNAYNGSFLCAPALSGVGSPSTGPYWCIASRGTTVVFTGSAALYPAPQTAVHTQLSAIPTDTNIIRLNGAQIAAGSADQGSGAYGEYPLYIGRRSNASIPFIGRLYSLIIRGAQSTDAQIANTEKWVNNKTKAYV